MKPEVVLITDVGALGRMIVLDESQMLEDCSVQQILGQSQVLRALIMHLAFLLQRGGCS